MVDLLKKLLSESWLAPAPWLLSLDMYVSVSSAVLVWAWVQENPQHCFHVYMCSMFMV